jgi:hypothetical protein
VITQTISEQLTEIYLKEEPWQKNLMPYDEALRYHQEALDAGHITCYVEDGEVLGYYERYFFSNVCFFKNIWIKQDSRRGKVFRSLRRVFLGAMPFNIDLIVGQKQKLGGKFMTAKTRR